MLASLGPYVSITRKRYARKRDEIGKASEEVLTAYIYVKDGVKIRKEVTIRPLSFSLKTQLRNGDYVCRAYEYYRQCLGKLNLKNN